MDAPEEESKPPEEGVGTGGSDLDRIFGSGFGGIEREERRLCCVNHFGLVV